MSTESLRIGRVVEVHGSRILGELEANVRNLYRTYRSRKYAVGQVGSIIKVESGDVLVFGVVTSLRMVEADPASASQTHSDPSSKWIDIELLGQGHKTGVRADEFVFERGVSDYPLPGQPVSLVTVEELRRIFAKPGEPAVQIGSVAQASGLPVYLLTNNLLGKHLAVLGTTGSGKSCAVTLLLRSIVRTYKNAHVILLDPHNEYARAFPNESELIDPTNLEIPHWLLNFEESVELFVGKTEYAATSQTNILKDALLKARRQFSSGILAEDHITVDSPVPYRLGDLADHVRAAMPSQDSKKESYNKILAKMDTLRADRRFEFLLRPDETVKDNLAALVGELLRIPGEGRPLTIIDLSGVPSDVVDVVVSVLCRTVFDFALWNPDRDKMPLWLVCEEAHRYVPSREEAAFQPTKRALSRIAKEGRKYGVGLCLVTQRPSELAISVLSQCNTILALRLSNDQDRQFVQAALPDSVRSLVEALPALRNREALIVGEGVTVPVRLMLDELPEDQRPRSANVDFAKAWADDVSDEAAVAKAVTCWREQKRVRAADAKTV